MEVIHMKIAQFKDTMNIVIKPKRIKHTKISIHDTTNIFDCLDGITSLLRCFGICANTRNGKTFKASKFGRVMILTHFIFISFIFKGLWTEKFRQDFLHNSHILTWTKIVVILKNIFGASLSIVLCGCELFYSHHFCTVVQELNLIDEAITKLGLDTLNIYIKKRTNVIIAFICLGCLLVTVYSISYHDYFDAFDSAVQLSVLFSLPLIITYFFTGFFCILLFIIQTKAAIINNRILGQLCNKKNYGLEESYLISEAKFIHSKLCNTISTLNLIYAASLLAEFWFCYTYICVDMFWWLSIFSTGQLDFRIVESVLIELTVIVCIVLFTVCSENCVTEINRTAIVLCKIVKHLKYQHSKDCVKSFILQMTNNTPNTYLKIGGMFPINKKLLVQLFSSATTNMLILIQFDYSAKSNDLIFFLLLFLHCLLICIVSKINYSKYNGGMSALAKPVLYSYWRSSCSWRVRICLNLKEIPYDIKAVSLIKGGGEQHCNEYRDVNPMEQVPALLIDGHTLVESLSIMHYLEETRPQRPLMPQDCHKRAKVREICEVISSGIQPLQNLVVLIYVGEEKKKEWAQHWITRGFRAVEKLLSASAGKYCVGDELTLADCCLIPQVFNARRFHVDLRPFPIILRIDRELENHPAFQAAHPSSQPDCPPEATK